MDKQNASISLVAVGDVCVDRKDPKSVFALSSRFTKDADISFCQLEVLYSQRGTASTIVQRANRADARNVEALVMAGFDVASMASNHAMDFGPEALIETIELLEGNDIRVIGAGKNIKEARRPAIFERKGVRTAFLAYNSILPHRSWAEADRAGCAPIRVHTAYEPIEMGQPGCAVNIITFADRADLQAMTEDISCAKKSADAVIVSMHWGIHHTPGLLATYQTEVGRAAIDAGADLIVGSHPHILKGIEVYKGKVIAYSLCNFAFDTHYTAEDFESPRLKEQRKHYPNRIFDPEYPTYSFAVDARKTMAITCAISKAGIERVSFVPVYITKLGQPEVLPASDRRHGEVFEYMNAMCKDLGTRLSVDGNDVVIETN